MIHKIFTTPLTLDFSDFERQALRFGDLDNSGRIDLDDILSLPEQYQKDPGAIDLNEDGVFDLLDVVNILQNWGVEDERSLF
ncbi:hypothetical protein IPJ72_03000 [Candidatus Peregrinibacteria bacterium]|nr:MAG: hypothetical protein IPJ72_03000 [Candidatus Peregrinibacteria bacterium]